MIPTFLIVFLFLDISLSIFLEVSGKIIKNKLSNKIKAPNIPNIIDKVINVY